MAWHRPCPRLGVESYHPGACLIAKSRDHDAFPRPYTTPQYTVFEQLKNILVAHRTSKLRASAGASKAAIAVLSDMDYFWLGAISKLGMSCIDIRNPEHVN